MVSKQKNSSASLKRPLSAKLIFILFGVLLISSTIRCANIQQPTGGPRDTIPPVLLGEFPENLSTNFAARKIVLNFDEFIKLNNPNQQISISPDMERFPMFNARRRSLEIELPDSLEKNTTYVINFGEAIADNNEGNPILNYSYVFSTGDEIDSLSISGQVISSRTNEPEIGASVILIPISQDSIFGKQKANIFANTDSSGNFRLQYLREDQYRIYALREQNNDRIYNNPNEWIGFLQDSINLSGDTSGIQLWISRPDPKQFRVLDRQIEKNGMVWFKLNQSLEKPELTVTYPPELNESKLMEVAGDRDSINLWLADMTFDSLKINIFDEKNLKDSVMIRRPGNDKYDRNIMVTTNLDRNKVGRINHLHLHTNAPIQQIDRSKIILLEDSVRTERFQLQRDSADNKKFIIRYNWKAKVNYDLTFEERTLRGYFEEQNEELTWSFTLEENEKVGDIALDISVPDTTINYIVELLSENKENILKTDVISNNAYINYKNFPEGKYVVRISYDENKNGRWDPGDLDEKIQPEKAWFYDKTFIIRPNWQQEEKISIPERNQQRQILSRTTDR